MVYGFMVYVVAKLMSCKDSVRYNGPVLSKGECKRELDRLQERYVISHNCS